MDCAPNLATDYRLRTAREGGRMGLRLFCLILLLGQGISQAADLPERYAPLGRLIITNFATAPFPHPSRAQGHQYHETLFGPEHYQDSHVALFIPKDFRPRGKIDFVVHFHGWRQRLTNVLDHYQLIDQFAASGCKAVLIVPQGPFDAPDSGGGKLEDENGFARFMAEAVDVLRQSKVTDSGEPGRIILSGHSGGYQVISSILAKGGLTDHVREVWLFDALYARTERFVLWFDHQPGRFIDLYTEHGGTKDETLDLMADLKGDHIPFFQADETNATPSELKHNHLIFLYSELPHDQVMQERHTFQTFLETSCLRR